MNLSARMIDPASYTGLIETLVGISIKLEFIRQALDPIDDAISTKLVTDIRDDTIKAAAFAKVDPAEWQRVSDQMIANLAATRS
jgi:hypothetical protein